MVLNVMIQCMGGGAWNDDLTHTCPIHVDENVCDTPPPPRPPMPQVIL